MFKQSDAVNVDWIETVGKVLCAIQICMLVFFSLFLWLGTAGRALAPDLADKLILRIPYYKDLVLSRNAYVVLYKFGLLVGSGIPMEESLALTAEGSPRGALRTDIERSLVFIRSGKTWANALETLHPTDRAALSSSTDREDTARTLDMLARQYRDMYMSRIKSFAPALQMVAALFMTASGALLFGLVILPMLQFSAGI
jgi:general secretion pathway protein F